jgi:hypothetical protein
VTPEGTVSAALSLDRPTTVSSGAGTLSETRFDE